MLHRFVSFRDDEWTLLSRAPGRTHAASGRAARRLRCRELFAIAEASGL